MAGLLEVEDLTVSVDGKRILTDVNLFVAEGELMALFGPNGSGKTTLLKAIMGFPAYRAEAGRIIFKGEDITGLSIDERSRKGIGIAFQSPPVVRGVKLGAVLHSIAAKRGPVPEDVISEYAGRLNLADFMGRELNFGFSGGELKRSELLQLIMQNPALTLFDEPDSGVDLENIHLVGSLINELLGRTKAKKKELKSALMITHAGYILDYVNPDRACIMLEGSIACVGNPRDILEEIREKGYEECVRCMNLGR
jgi:Fe-S cluster assembly ATP-binding protein